MPKAEAVELHWRLTHSQALVAYHPDLPAECELPTNCPHPDHPIYSIVPQIDLNQRYRSWTADQWQVWHQTARHRPTRVLLSNLSLQEAIAFAEREAAIQKPEPSVT